ncbi:MAG: DUF4034 domain-containing protein [Lentisphaerae bacterium]|nr:DUF4034 domain-containing protein [Lentisphaerota bacterium]
MRINTGMLLAMGAMLIGCSRPYSGEGQMAAPIKHQKNQATKLSRSYQSVEFYNTIILEPYKRLGKKDPQWEEQALCYIQNYIDFAAKDKTSKIRPEDMLQKGHYLIHTLGCNDPVVCFCYGRCVYALRNEEYRSIFPLMEQTAKSLKEGNYPRVICYQTPRDLAKSKHPNANEYAREAIEQAILAIAQTQYILGHEEAWLKNIRNVFDNCSLWSQPYLDQIRAAVDGNPDIPWYEKHVMTGMYHYYKAWAHRGGDYANTVTEKGWREFNKHMEIARVYLTEAWEEEPNKLMAPLQMINVAGMGFAGEGETERLWFDRTITVELDNVNAYIDLIFVTLPRWGGSLDQIYSFGLACLETKRYDTLVPLQYLLAMEYIKSELDGDRNKRWWRKAGVPKKIRRMIAGYRKEKNCPIRQSWLSSLELIDEWEHGNLKKAGAMLEALGNDHLEQEPFRLYYYYKADTSGPISKLIPLYNDTKPEPTEFTALPLRIEIPKPSPEQKPRTAAKRIPKHASEPAELRIGMLLSEVIDIIGPAPARLKTANMTIWSYSDLDIESVDGKTVSSIVRR